MLTVHVLDLPWDLPQMLMAVRICLFSVLFICLFSFCVLLFLYLTVAVTLIYLKASIRLLSHVTFR